MTARCRGCGRPLRRPSLDGYGPVRPAEAAEATALIDAHAAEVRAAADRDLTQAREELEDANGDIAEMQRDIAQLRKQVYRLHQIRDAARLHRQQLITTSELYAAIEATDEAAAARPDDTTQDRGEAARQAAGIDGTAGDAQDVPHALVADTETGGCLLCGLAPGYRKHTPRPDDTDTAPRCAHCTHPRSDHSDRRDHTPVTLRPRRPWCHACNAACDYAAAARPDNTGA